MNAMTQPTLPVTVRQASAPMLRTIICTTILLAVLLAALYLYWGRGPVIAILPLFFSLMQGIVGLAAFCVAYIAFSRYQVERDAVSYWIGVAFISLSISNSFYILSWPGLAPKGYSLIAHLTGTPAWISTIGQGGFGGLLLLAALLHWPLPPALSKRRWYLSVAAWMAGVLLVNLLLVVFETCLPAMVGASGTFSPLLMISEVGLVLLYALGAVLSLQRYRHSGDRLLAYVTVLQIAITLAQFIMVIGGKRYDLWWYLARLFVTGGFLTLLFGMLSEYVRIYRGERERNRALELSITERKQAEEALRASERRERERAEELAIMLKAMPTPVIIVDDSDGFHMTGNLAADELLRLPHNTRDFIVAPVETRPRHFKALKDGRELRLDELPAQRAARGAHVRDFEFTLAFDDGTIRHVLGYGTPLLDEQGHPRGAAHAPVDITERKLAEEGLCRGEDRYHRLFDSMTEGFLLAELMRDAAGKPVDFRIIEANLAYESVLGCKREDAIGRTLFELFPGLAYDRFEAHAYVAQTGKPLRWQGLFEPTGRYYECFYYSPRPGQLAGIFMDITERKLAEVALQESEERYRSLFAVIPSGVAVYEVINDGNDLDGKDFIFKDMNPSGEKIDHVHKAEIIGKSLYECFPNVREIGLVEVFKRVWQTGVPEFFPVTLYTDHNISLWVTNYVWRLPSGELVAMFDDITELKRAEEALRKSECSERERAEELAVLLESVPTGVYISYDPDCRHMTGNYAADEILRIPHGNELSLTGPAETRPTHFRTMKDGRELRLNELPAQRSARGEQIKDFEFDLVFEDAIIRHVLGYGTPLLDEQGSPRGSVTVLVDITERKQAEQALQASLREKEVLLKEIHHRVKNNMQVISSLVSLQADSLDNPALRPLFNDLRDRVRTMALVHEKLYQSDSLANVDFAEYTRSLLNYLWRAHGAGKTNVRLTLDVQPMTLTVETAVPCGLLLNELVTNALKHAFHDRADGELKVMLHAEADGRVCLCVSDNGAGLPAGWQQSSSLGLQLVQMLTSQVHGTLDARSDGGTAFTLTFALPSPPQRGEDQHV